ncbi:MAG: GIY-YIG nuclease family protein [Alphaproteobacteria bacterium]|nr:MAG: GIY-YIG nuclease family protein [Alphaproteobacteria bacterium]
MRQFYVYILTNRQYGTLYVGMTGNLARRIWEHKSKSVLGFTKTYGLDRLVYFEVSDTAQSAAQRERQIKRWNRAWKIQLIEKTNPEWIDLYDEVNR